MTYREMAMDAGCTSEEEIAQMASYLAWEEQQAYERWIEEQRWEEEMAKEELANELNSELQMHGVD